MTNYVSTDPNFGLGNEGYVSTDPNFGLQEQTPENQDNALKRGWNKMIQSVGITGALATGDADSAAQKIAEAARYQQANPGTPEGNELMAAWQRGDGISGGLKEVGGEFAKDWREASSTIKAIRATGANIAAMGSGIVEQMPNMLPPMAGMLGGGAAGSAVGPVGTVGGAWAGASTGNALVEGGGMAQEALHKAGINPMDTEAVKAYLSKNGDDLLLKAGIKGAVIGAVDTATMGIATKLLTGPAKAAAGRALVDMGVDVADQAAVKAAMKSPELAARVAADPIYKAATTGAQGVARNATAAALEPAGEFTGEYLGQGLATGEYDEKEAFLEAASSIGQSGATFAGQKAYAALKYPFKADKGGNVPVTPPATIAGDVLGTPEQADIRGSQIANTDQTEAEKALYTPKSLTALDRVAEIDAKLTAATTAESSVLQAERDSITASWPKATPGAETSFTTEAGARLNGQYALMEAGDLTTSHDESLRPVVTYPAELQPRERERHASEMQIQQIVGRLDPARLGESADVATGAPIVGADGLVESGNARTIALKRVYQANGQKAIDYKQYLKDNAARFGITPESVDAMQKPVLVRVRATPVNRAEFARQANQSTVARMSPSEQAKSDAAQIDSLDDLNPNESGDFSSGTSAGFIRRFMAKLPATEQAGLIDSAGRLSQAGYQRIRNAVLAKAYGDSPVLQRMVESLDNNLRNVGQALLRVAPQVAKTREAINEGALHDADLTPDLMAAVEELSALKDKGTSVAEALAQAGMFGDKLSPESRELLAFLDENIRSPRRMAEFVQNYLDALTTAGNPAQGSMFGDSAAPAKRDLIAAARRITNGESATTGSANSGDTATTQESGQQSENSQGNQAGARGNEAKAITPEELSQAADASWEGMADNARDFLKQWVEAQGSGMLQRLRDAARRLWLGDSKASTDADASLLQALYESGAPIRDFLKSKADSNGQITLYRGLRNSTRSESAPIIESFTLSEWVARNFAGKDGEVVTVKVNVDDIITLANEPEQEILVRPSGRKVGADETAQQGEWLTFPPDTGTLGIPRAEMPQIKGDHRGALIQFLQGRGINHETVEMPASELKPTQAEFSTKKVANWTEKREGADRSVLASSDGYILDGHHQWVAALAAGETEKVIRFDVPIQELLEAAREFPSVKKSDGAPRLSKEEVRREIIEQKWQEALSDLGAIVRDIVPLARMLPEDTPNLMPTLVKLFEAGFGKVGMGAVDLMKYVKAELKKIPEFKTVWNKIDNYVYRKAAAQALENHQAAPQGDLFGQAVDKAMQAQGDLFAQPAQPEKKVGAGGTAMYRGKSFDLKRDNWKWPKPDTFMPGEVVARARELIKKFSQEKADPIVSANDRVSAEKLLTPLLKVASDLSPAYTQAIIDMAADLNLDFMIGPLKAMDRSIIKLATDTERNADGSMDIGQMRDVLRSTIVVKTYADAQRVVDEIYKRFTVEKGRIKNRTDAKISAPDVSGRQGFLPSGYGDVLVNIDFGGVKAEIQINIPEMISAKMEEGHKLYEIERDAPVGSDLRAATVAAQADYYREAAEANARASAMNPASSDMSPDFGRSATGKRDAPSAASPNAFPSGNLTLASPSELNANTQSAGNLSGTFISSTSDPSIANDGQIAYTEGNGKSTGYANGQHGKDGTASPQGQGTLFAPATERGGDAAPVRDGTGKRDRGSDQRSDDADRQQEGRVSGAVPEPDGKGGDTQSGAKSGNGKRARRDAGIPAGRDIPAKSGRNYAFGDGDLTYAGSWITKARQNVEAVELLKKLQSENRQATREEQAVLAKFIGWGASDLANNIFGPQDASGKTKLDRQLEALENYDEAIRNLGDRPYLTNARYSEYRPAFELLQSKNQALNWYTAGNITKAMLDAAKPDASARKWGELRDRLKAVLTPEEFKEASKSTQYAHYTSKSVVSSILSAVEKMGFKGGTILEPGAGIGVFPGLMQTEMGVNSVYTGIEMDSITGGILKQLFPDERILVESFIDSKLPENFYDVAIGNPPFSGQVTVLADPKYAKHAFKLHDYFFAKSLDSVKPGGLVVFVTSRYTMDKKGDKARAFMAERADLVGAVRLPQTAFQKNAGTDVVTDVLFLRKKVPGETFAGAQSWMGLGEVNTPEGKFLINEYFTAHPEMVLGEHSGKGKMQNTTEPQYTLLARGGDIEAQFAAAVANLPSDVFVAGRGSAAEAARVREMDFDPKAEKEGAFYISPAGVVMRREGGVGVRAEEKHQKDKELIKDYVALRDALKQAQYDQLNDGDWESSLKALQKAYAGFVKKNGRFWQNTPYLQKVKVEELDEEGIPTGNKIEDEEERRRFTLQQKVRTDPEWTLVSALENFNEETGEISESDWLSRRTLGGEKKAEIRTPTDALLATLDDTGEVNIPLIAERMGMEESEVIDSLGTLIYDDPAGGWTMADEYLSGNVKSKLAAAEEAAKSDKRYQRNVDALKDVQPAPKGAGDIKPQIGMNWIPGEVYAQFLRDLSGVKATIEYVERTHEWTLVAHSGFDTPRATSDWGVGDRANAAWLMEKALTGATISLNKAISDGKGGTKMVFDPDRTEAANAKRVAMRQEFQNWIFQDAARTAKLVTLYNDKFNTTVQRKFDGRHLTLPGTSKLFDIFDHVKRGAWRVIQTGNTYLAHAVGSGKAQPLDAKVLTPDGWRRMGDIAPGDMVIAGDGSPTMVEAVFPQGEKEIFRVEFNDGSATECCDEHLWLTQTYKERTAHQRAIRLGKHWPHGLAKVRSLAEIRETLVSAHLGAKNHSIPMVAPVQFAASPLPIDSYVMGVLLGDGGMTGSSIILSCADDEILSQVSARLPDECELVHRSNYDYAVVWRGEMRYRVGGGAIASHPVQNAMRSMGLMGKPSHEKFIPDQYLFNTTEARVALLQGLMDTDGTVEGGGTSTRFSTTSRRLADDVTTLVQSLGGLVRERKKAPTCTHNGERRFGRPSFDLCLSLPADINPFRLMRKASKVVPKSKYSPARYITAVEPVGKKQAQCIRVAHPSHLYVTDDFVVTHNTFEMVISAMEQKRLGKVKKPMIIVPGHMLQQFASEWQQLYPTARLAVADEKDFHTDNRRKFVARVAMSDLDGVIMTHSSFQLLDLDPEFKQGMIKQELEFLRASYEEAGGDLDDIGNKKMRKEPKIKRIEAQIERLEQNLAKAMSSEGKDKSVRFDEMGVDFLYVDEAHLFRKLSYATNRQMKGIDPNGSEMAWDLYMKTRWLAKKNPKRYLVMASGTPITNTTAELYTVQRFMAPEALEEKGLQSFDDWAAQFGEEATAIEATSSGKYEPVTRFSKFINVGEMTQMFRDFADVLTEDHLAALLGDKRPKVEGGARKSIITPKTESYVRFQQQDLIPRIEASKQFKPSFEQPNNPDPIININTDARLASIDMRFMGSTLPNDPDSKLNRMIDGVIRIYKETADNEYRAGKKGDGEIEALKGAAQMVFFESGFGKAVAARRGFNARAWMEKRLRDAGIPANQLAFMEDYKKSTAKLKLFKDVNTGKVRILVGSSTAMGTGVNAQQRLIALHHLDAPYVPATLEQREGRIIRQGNKNPKVQIYAYSMKGSFDENQWGMLARKKFFIEQALSGDQNIREIDDVGEVNQLEMAAGLVAENPYVMQHAGAKADVERLMRLSRAHEESRARMQADYDNAGRTIEFNERALPEAEKEAARVKNLSGDDFTAKADGKSFDNRKEWGQAILAQYKALADKMTKGNPKIGEMSGFDVLFVGSMTPSGIYEARVKLLDTVLASDPLTDPVGMAMRGVNALVAIERKPAEMRRIINEAKAKRDSLTTRLDAPFPMAEQLANKVKEVAELEKKMTEYGNEKTGLAREQELEDAWQQRTGAITPMFSRNLAYNETDALPNETAGNRTLNGAELEALRRIAARVERPQAGVYLRVTEDGRAIATGPKGTKVPETFRRFAKDNNLVFTAGRIVPDYKGGIPPANMDIGITKKSEPMPIIYRQSGALYFGEMGAAIDRTGKSTFSRGTGRGMALRDLQAVVDRIAKGFKNLPRVHVLSSPSDLSTKDPSQKALRDFIKKSGAWNDVEGATHDGEIYLFASGMADEARAEFVLAEHEVTHYGLRGVMGKELDPALQHIYLFNGKVRVTADAMKKSRGLRSNLEAVEEVLADMPSSQLAKLRGWRKVVQVMRNWLNKVGAKKLAAKLDAWMRAGLSDQEKADLLVADLVSAAREWVKSGKGSATTGTHLAEMKLADDWQAQEKWLEREAKARGYKSIDELAEKAYPVFEKLAALWRQKHPVEDALLSRVVAEWKSTDNPPEPGKPFMVYRLARGGEMNLNGKNAADAEGLAAFIMSTEDFDSSISSDGDTIYAYEVTADKFGQYETYNKGRTSNKYSTVGMMQKWGGHWLSFPDGAAYQSRMVGSFSLEQARSKLNELHGYRTFDDSGVIKGAEAIREIMLQDFDGANLPRLSRAVPPAPTIRRSQTADDIINKSAGTPRPLDALVKGAVTMTGLPKLTTMLYNKAGFLLDRFTPETVKAGLVADYGIPEAVIDARAVMEGRQRKQLRGVGTLLEKLATLTRAESRVAYEWMNNDNPQAADYLEKQLPEESIKVLKEVRDLIDTLSQEAIRLGQLSPDAYARNKFAYLRRSYVKHTAELTKGETAGRARAIAILGDQYKGRGMTDAVDMTKFKAVAPEWWNRKLKVGQADKQLKGEKFVRLERRAPIGEGTAPLDGMTGPTPKKQRLLEVAYWPAGEPIPARMSTWDQAGTWEVRDTKGGKLVVWRDFTKQERTAMGEIDEARYAIAKTLHGMIHDVEVGKYLEWLGQKYAKKEGEQIDGEIVEASERMRDTFKPGEWVQVPDTKIPGTQVKKYGTLAGRYIPGPIWNDVRQIMGGQFKPLGDTYAAIHRAWKTSKTALSPAVHMNNVMANFVMADWHDVTAGHIHKALKLMVSKDPAAADVLARFGDSGGTIGTWATKELQQEQLRPLLEALEKELGMAGNAAGQVGVMSALQLALHRKFGESFDALKSSKLGKGSVWIGRKMIDMYEAEDQVFRLAAWLKAKEEGASDLAAGKVARKSFLDYSINAPWVQMMRGTAFPFVAFTYRSVPMLLDVAAKKPWKLMKLGMVFGAINALGYMLSGGDEDDERKLLPEEKAGRIWGLTPKLIRMPWSDDNKAPVFLDVRRWIPVGDIFDTGQTHSALPVLPMMQPGGPLALLAEFSLDKKGFTGKSITLETDTPIEKAAKTADWLYKAFAPNIAVLPGTYAWTAIANAGGGKTDSFGRELSLTQAIVSSVGIKVGSYPKDVLQLNAQREAQAKMMEIDRNITGLKREYQKHGIGQQEYQEKVSDQVAKKRKLYEDLNRKISGG